MLAETANVSLAARAAHVARRTPYNWLKDPAFKVQWDQALELGIESLESEAIRRGYEGVLKPVYHNGKKVGEVRVFSDALLMLMLQARRPEKYGERVQVQHDAGLLEEFKRMVRAHGH